MIEFIGWAAFILGGAWAIFAGFMFIGLFLVRGGLETLGPALFTSATAALAWIAFAVWLSPVTVSI
ncbi:MAG: hypothetical protein U5L08_04490 [Xanthomonadales bacterium]|nr:hypothetical protein [Xanthomonadales bacterium]